MRARGHPARPATPVRPSVLLTTEAGASGDFAGPLVRGMADVDFVVWSLGPPPDDLVGKHAPPNVVRTIAQPEWSHASRETAWALGRAARSRRHPSPGKGEQAFAPLLRSFLETTIDPAGPGERLAAALLDLRDVFRRTDPAMAWRSPAVWDVVRDHLLLRTADTGGADVDPDSDRGDLWSSDVPPTVGEAVEAVQWLAQMLEPLTDEVPQVDLVHATTAGCSAIPGIVAKVERGTPLLLSEHDVAPRRRYLALREMGAPFHLKRFSGSVSGALARTTYRLADRMTPATRHTMRWEVAYGAPRGRVEVIHPGVDDELFRPIDVPRPERPTVVQIAPIDTEHDPETMLAVAEVVREEIPDVVFLHFGDVADPVLWERVRELRKERGLEETVRFGGAAVDIPRALALGDVALVTSRSETLPAAVLQAATCAVAVVATDTAGVREALNGGGIVAPVGDAAALANAVAATLRISAAQRDRVRRAARDLAVLRFGLRRFLADYRAQYERLGLLTTVTDERRAPTQRVPVGIPEHATTDVAAEASTGGATDAPVEDESVDSDVEVPPVADATLDAIEPVPAGTDPGGPTERPFATAADHSLPDRPPDLRAPIRDPDPLVRAEAVRGLTDVEGASRALGDDAPEVRLEAARVLGRLDGPRAGHLLTTTVSEDPSPAVRGEAVLALAALLTRSRHGDPPEGRQ